MKSVPFQLSIPVHVVMERNVISGDTVPVMVCTSAFDANVVRVMLAAERFLTSEEEGEQFEYTVTENVRCLD